MLDIWTLWPPGEAALISPRINAGAHQPVALQTAQASGVYAMVDLVQDASAGGSLRSARLQALLRDARSFEPIPAEAHESVL